MSSFRSCSPPLCFERVGSTSETADVTDLSQSNSNLDFDPCWSSSTSIKFDYNSLLKSHTTVKQVPNQEIKDTITSSSNTVDGSTGLVSTLSSVVKRLSTAELEHMIQSQLGKVIGGHRHTTWLRKQVDESDAQMAKYKNRIEILQKHVNDLSTVIQKHMQSSEESSYCPPRKLTRNVGLQVRIKEKGSELCQGSVDAMLPTAQDIPESSTNKQNEKQPNCCIKLDKQLDGKESNQKSSSSSSLSSIEIDLTLSDSDESPCNKSTAISAPPLDRLPVADCKFDSEKSTDSSGLPGFCTPPSFIPAMDVTSNNSRTISTTTTLRPSSNIIPSAVSVELPCLESESTSSTSDCSTGTCPMTNSPSNQPEVGFVYCTTQNPAPPPLIPSSGCHPSAGPSGAYLKNASNGSYSDRKRRLPCSITSIDASTVASVEKYNKLIKERWYDSDQLPAEMPSSSVSSSCCRPTCMSQSEVQNQHPSMPVVQSVSQRPIITQNPCQTNKMRLPIIPKPIHQREFAKKVESIGLYHKWKLPIPPYISTLPPAQSPPQQPIRQSVILQLPKQQHLQIPNIRTWIPRSSCLDSYPSPARQCAPDVEDAHSTQQLPNPIRPLAQPIQQQHINESYMTADPAQSPHGSKKGIPDLIAITNEDRGLSPSLPASPTVNEWKTNVIITSFKPILMLTRSDGGIRVEWTIPNLTRSQQVSQIESYVLFARKENGIVPPSETTWLKVAVFSALPLPMSYIFKELTRGYRYYFRIGANFRPRQGDARTHEIPFSEPASMMM